MLIEPHKILIIGARSKVAEALIRHILSQTTWNLVLLSSGFTSLLQVDRVTCYAFDYNHPQMLKEIMLKELPDFTINCAAMTDVDSCEDDRLIAWNINVKLVETICRMCMIIDSHLIHFSTDYIFDGNKGLYYETDKPNPISYYGKTKLASENVCRTSGVKSTILRTNVVYGTSSYRHTDFVEWVLTRLEMKIPFRVVSDQISNPIITDDIALSVIQIIKLEKSGVYNLAGVDWISRYDFAQSIASIFDFNGSIIHSMLTSELSQKAKRPLKGGLLTLKAETELGVKFSSVHAGLLNLRQQKLSKTDLNP